MKSPKFSLRKTDLSKIVTQNNIKRVWRDTVREAMRGQLIEDPIELYDIHVNISNVASAIAARVTSGDYVPKPPRRVLLEKTKGMCRQVVVPHADDCLVLQTLSDALHPLLKPQTPHRNAFYQPDRGMSNRAKLDYGGMRAWLDFQREVLEFTKRRKVIVVTDIANFYDTIDLSHLRNILSNYLPENKETLLDLTLHILSAMQWQPDYMPRAEVGLPQINLDAPRMLANSYLFELDKFISTDTSLDYARYMDDIDVGIDSIAQAKPLLRDIDLVLQPRQLRLNAGKTKILTGRSIDLFYRTAQNYLLDLLTDRINSKSGSVGRHRLTLARLFRGWNRRKQFDGDGNGEKILKRIINLALKVELAFPPSEVYAILRLRPNLREVALRYISRIPAAPTYIPMLMRFIDRVDIIDDACPPMLASRLVEMRMENSFQLRKRIAEAASRMLERERKETWVYAALWILSKYGTAVQIMDAIDRTYPVWQPDYQLGRLVASLAVLIPDDRRDHYSGLLRSSGNAGATEVTLFYEGIRKSSHATTAIFRFLKANNGNPNRISHPKWLVLIHVLASGATPVGTKIALRKAHQLALTDTYYRAKVRLHSKF